MLKFPNETLGAPSFINITDLASHLAESFHHPVQLPTDELLKQCDVKRTRASGPGGQHRNKVETAIVITHKPTGIVGQASETRQQERNRKTAVQRLRVNLALGIRVHFDSPSSRWIGRVKGRKISVSPEHDDYPIILAEALDCILVAKFDVVDAAKKLQVSTSQLIKLLKAEPAAFEWLNRQRDSLKLHRIQ